MIYLGIDYGTKQTGFAYSESGLLAQPLNTVATSTVTSFISEFLKTNTVSTIVIGLPEGKMHAIVKAFGQNLKDTHAIPVVFWDETLTTRLAGKILIKTGGSRKKRKTKEHTGAAGLILQSFLDEQHTQSQNHSS